MVVGVVVVVVVVVVVMTDREGLRTSIGTKGAAGC
jgi:hypothetical protein